jgi:hypothetical protein
MEKARKYQACAVCGGRLEVLYDMVKHEAYLACHADQTHKGIAKEYKERDYNILTRRGFMTTEIGEQKTTALAKYSGVTSLTKQDAREIIITIWPEAEAASPAEVFKAVSICAQYGLNPLMKHLFLIPFKDHDTQKVTFSAVLGIGANRLIASRKHRYSYIDNTPRYMTEDEEKRYYRTVDPKKIRFITKLKDMTTGAEAVGFGQWNAVKVWNGKESANEPKGMDKGNSMENMAAIRSERQALDRLYPAEMPTNIEVVDEHFIDGTATVLQDEKQIEKKLPDQEADNILDDIFHKEFNPAAEAVTVKDKTPEQVSPVGPATSVTAPEKNKNEAKLTGPETVTINIDDLLMKMTDKGMTTAGAQRSWIAKTFPGTVVSGPVEDIIRKLSPENQKKLRELLELK